jgi:hypothetical protein
MDLKELQKIAKRRAEKSDLNRFDLEDALMDGYLITSDLDLALDDEERKAACKMHLRRMDKILDIFESLIMKEKII